MEVLQFLLGFALVFFAFGLGIVIGRRKSRQSITGNLVKITDAEDGEVYVFAEFNTPPATFQNGQSIELVVVDKTAPITK